MEAEKLYKTLKRQPFEPIRIHVSDGASYDIKHPDQVVVAKRWAHIGLGAADGGPFQDIAIVSLLHVTRIEPIRRRKTTSKRR